MFQAFLEFLHKAYEAASRANHQYLQENGKDMSPEDFLQLLTPGSAFFEQELNSLYKNFDNKYKKHYSNAIDNAKYYKLTHDNKNLIEVMGPEEAIGLIFGELANNLAPEAEKPSFKEYMQDLIDDIYVKVREEDPTKEQGKLFYYMENFDYDALKEITAEQLAEHKEKIEKFKNSNPNTEARKEEHKKEVPSPVRLFFNELDGGDYEDFQKFVEDTEKKKQAKTTILENIKNTPEETIRETRRTYHNAIIKHAKDPQLNKYFPIKQGLDAPLPEDLDTLNNEEMQKIVLQIRNALGEKKYTQFLDFIDLKGPELMKYIQEHDLYYQQIDNETGKKFPVFEYPPSGSVIKTHPCDCDIHLPDNPISIQLHIPADITAGLADISADEIYSYDQPAAARNASHIG